jgi:iron complex outermembrane receptor protein
MRKMRTLQALAVATLAGLSCIPKPAAADDTEAAEQAFLTELPVVLSASRLAQPLADAPGAVTVIDRELIRASGARDIADLFRLVPGFLVAYANGANPTVNYHGLTGQYSPRMQVLIDGRSMYSSFYLGGVDWNTIPIALDDIERIEVVRGSNSAAYGANAFLGVANIITRHASQSRGTLAEYTNGNQAIEDNLLRHGARLGDLDFRFSAGRRRDSGFDNIHDDRHVSFFNFRGDYRLTAEDELTIQLGANENSAGAGFSGNAENPTRTQQASHYFAQLHWRRSLPNDGEIGLRAYQVRESGADIYVSVLPFLGSTHLDFSRRTERDSFEIQHVFRPSNQTRVVWGAEKQTDRLRSAILLNNADWHTTAWTRLFGNLEWRAAPWLLVNAGGLWEYYNLTGKDFSPRLMVNFQPTPEHTVRLGTSRANRTPSLLEQKGDLRAFFPLVNLTLPVYVGGQNLQPEKIRSYEISYLGDFRALGLTVDARLFREHVSRLVTTYRDGTALVFANGYSALLRGAEYQLRWRPGRKTLALLNQSFERIVGMEKFRSYDTTVTDLMQSAPTRRTTLMLSHQFADRWSVSAIQHWIGEMKWPHEGDLQRKHRRLDLRLGWRFGAGPTRGELALVTQNQGNPYDEFRPQYKFNRRTFATLSLEF